jgi:uncharacterized protein
MIAVSNSSPLMWLPKIGCLQLLEKMFPDGVVFPGAVFDEVVIQGGDRAGVGECRSGLSRGWLKVLPVEGEAEHLLALSLKDDLDPGEAEAIALALRLKPHLILLDEHEAREKAKHLGLKPMGVLGVLLYAKEREWLPAVKPLVDDLWRQGFRVSKNLYKEILGLAGEG